MNGNSTPRPSPASTTPAKAALARLKSGTSTLRRTIARSVLVSVVAETRQPCRPPLAADVPVSEATTVPEFTSPEMTLQFTLLKVWALPANDW